jgi:hypothetical protein
MSWQAKFVRMVVAVVLTAAGLGTHANAQALNSGARMIALQAVLTPSLTVALSGNAVNFNMAFGNPNNPGNTSITATTSWALNTAIGFVSRYAYFGNSASALTDGAGNNIPSADFQISDNGGAFNVLNTTVPFGGANAGRRVAGTLIFLNNMSGQRTDVMNFNINLSTLPTLPAGNYTGTLTIQAQAI